MDHPAAHAIASPSRVARVRRDGASGLSCQELRMLMSADDSLDAPVEQILAVIEPQQMVDHVRSRLLKDQQAKQHTRDRVDDALTWLEGSIRAGDPISPDTAGGRGSRVTQADLRALERLAAAARTRLGNLRSNPADVARAAILGLQRRLGNADDIEFLLGSSQRHLLEQIQEGATGICRQCHCTDAVRCRRDCFGFDGDDDTLCGWCFDEKRRCADGCQRGSGSSDSSSWTCATCDQYVCVGCGVGPVLVPCYFCDGDVHRGEFDALDEDTFRVVGPVGPLTRRRKS